MMHAYGALLAGWMAQSGFRDGCPVTTILLELSPAVAAAGKTVFRSWTEVLAAALRRAGAEAAEADRFASVAISMIEGSPILARVAQETRPIEDAVAVMADMFAAATRRG